MASLTKNSKVGDVIVRFPKVKTEPNFEPVRALPKEPFFNKFLSVDLDERDDIKMLSIGQREAADATRTYRKRRPI